MFQWSGADSDAGGSPRAASADERTAKKGDAAGSTAAQNEPSTEPGTRRRSPGAKPAKRPAAGAPSIQSTSATQRAPAQRTAAAETGPRTPTELGAQASFRAGTLGPDGTLNGAAPAPSAYTYGGAPTAIGIDATALDPWRRGVRVLAGVGAAVGLAYAAHVLLPSPAAMLVATCRKVTSMAGDAPATQLINDASTAAARAGSGAPASSMLPVVATAQYAALRAFWGRCAVCRAVFVASAPAVVFGYLAWLLDHTALVARALREAVRPHPSAAKRARRWHHALLELGFLVGGAAAAAALVGWGMWLVRSVPRRQMVVDLHTFIAARASSASSASSSRGDGSGGLLSALRYAVPLFPAAYPDVAATATCYVLLAAGAIRSGVTALLGRVAEYRSIVLFRANDDDEMPDAPVP